jgi:DnaK suppressor protein
MSDLQLAYFRKKLEDWRESLLEESQRTIEHLRELPDGVGDEADMANKESDRTLELRTRDRYRKLLRKIDAAIKRIEDGSYGYCDDTGDEIGIRRLEVRPIATLTVEAQEQREKRKGQYADVG